MGSGGKHTSAVIQARSDDNNLNAPQSKKMEIPSGFHAYRWHMLSGFFFLSVIYFGTIAAFDTIRDFLQLPPSSPELCENQQEELCWRADLFAFEIVSGVALAWCGILGVWAWHIQRTHLVPATPEGRLFGYLPEAHQLTALGTTFQVFDLCISLIIPEQRQPLFLCHHIMAATVSWYGLNNQYFHYYGIFYLGCSEISTIPLVAIDVAGFFPPVPGSTFDQFVNGFCGPAFAVTFTIYRVILWWIVGYQMFQDIFVVLRNGMAHKLRPGRNHVLYVMMILNLLLGLLQLYWFQIILAEAAKVLGFTATTTTMDESDSVDVGGVGGNAESSKTNEEL